MASKTTQSANDVINYLLRNVAPSWAGNANLYLSLHTGTVGVGGDQLTNEVSYTGYSRVALIRNASTGVFSAAATRASSNNALLQFGNPTDGTFPIVITHVAIGENSAGAGTVLAFGALSPSLTINLNNQPQFATGTLTLQEA
jgi:hypothetical protein